MAGSRYAYVRDFELADVALPNTYLVFRFSDRHHFTKPNDAAALELMNEAARHVMAEFKGHITLAFGESDEYSKLMSHIVSLFSSAYVMNWSKYMSVPLEAVPSFDSRLVMYPGSKEVRDYFAWRQADTHINNLYNTVFWALVQQGGKTEREAHERLKGTVSADKHEILYQEFQINYDKLPALFRKGTTLVWAPRPAEGSTKAKTELRTLHVDIIGNAFWTPSELAARPDDLPDVPWYDQPVRLDGQGLGAKVLRS